eukprot:1131991-Amphidinium_carterae.1
MSPYGKILKAVNSQKRACVSFLHSPVHCVNLTGALEGALGGGIGGGMKLPGAPKAHHWAWAPEPQRSSNIQFICLYIHCKPNNSVHGELSAAFLLMMLIWPFPNDKEVELPLAPSTPDDNHLQQNEELASIADKDVSEDEAVG